MSEPTKEDIDAAKQAVLDRLDALERRNDSQMEGWRQQQSAEHGAHQASLMGVREALIWIKAWCNRMFRNEH